MATKRARTYTPELREQAVDLVRARRGEFRSEWSAIEAVAVELDVASPQTLQHWVKKQRALVVGGEAGTAGARQQQGERTRLALVAAARSLFVSPGYFDTGAAQIAVAARAGSKGAFYHHFSDRREIFVEVFVAVRDDMARNVIECATGENPLDRLRSSLSAFLAKAIADDEVRRIMLIDGPAVLGWQQWRTLCEQGGLAGIEELVEQAVAAGMIRVIDSKIVAALILGLVDEAALAVASAQDQASAHAAADDVLAALLRGLSVSGLDG